MQFVFQPLAWGFLLVLVPLLIHLINLLRHRRQRWAAMEFLLESYRKHRRWVWMKQLLLLLSRMAVMAVLVAMLAQWVSGSRWLSLFGQTVTHHYVLLDDSMSMGDTMQGTSAYQLGLRAIGGLLRSVADDQGSHQLTVLRYSRASLLGASVDARANETDSQPGQGKEGPPSESEKVQDQAAKPLIDTVADLLSRTIPTNPDALLERLNGTSPVPLDVDPVAPIQTIVPLIRSASDEQPIVYLVSDFRAKDWSQSQAIREAMEPLKALRAEVQLIDCVSQVHENMGLVALKPDQEVLAAGVPLMMRLDVSNPGTSVLRNVNVSLKLYEYEAGQTEPRSDRMASGNEVLLPPLVIDTIGAGETVSRRFQVVFGKPGSHVVHASLPDDSLADDNTIASVLEIVEQEQLLIIDGSDDRRAAFYLNATLNPGNMTRTGWKPTTEGPAYLRDVSPETLASFAGIVLLNVRSLDPRAVSNLESFAEKGGGVAVFLGGSMSDADYDRMNREWYRQGEGFLPLPIQGKVALGPATEAGASPDIIPLRHPIFESLLGLSQSPFQMIRVSQHIAWEKGTTEDPNSPADRPSEPSWNVVAKLRDGTPWIIDRSWGDGRVVVIGTALDPAWTNWQQDPTFVVAMLKMVGYFTSFRPITTAALVGVPVEWRFSSREMLPEVEILLPRGGGSGGRSLVAVNGTPVDEPLLQVGYGIEQSLASEQQLRSWLSPGIIEIWGTTLQGTRVVKNFARNVPPAEGELSKTRSAELLDGLQPIEAKYRLAESVMSATVFAGLTNRQGILLALLILLLLIEQFLAWSASYHLPTTVGGRASS